MFCIKCVTGGCGIPPLLQALAFHITQIQGVLQKVEGENIAS
jgi:hypothetical protein